MKNMFTKLIPVVLLASLFLSACNNPAAPAHSVAWKPWTWGDRTAAETAQEIRKAADDQKMIDDAKAYAEQLANGGSPVSPTMVSPVSDSAVAPVAQPGSFVLAEFCYDSSRLGITFPTSRQSAHDTFIRLQAGDTQVQAENMSPLLTDAGSLYGWAYQAHGSSAEPKFHVTNPTKFMQNGWMADANLRNLYGYTTAEASILESGRDVTGAGIPGLTKLVLVEGASFFCAPPSADMSAVLPGHHLVSQRSNSGKLEQLPLLP